MATNSKIVLLNGLPKREQDIFHVLCDHYEKRAFKKAFRSAQEILENFPDQPDTLSMLGLTKVTAPKEEGGDKSAGLDLIKKGLRLSNFASFICWHAYGLYYRAEKMYVDAIKCYKNALKYSIDNFQILRDLATLQAHVRDLPGVAETRRKILQLKPTILVNWFHLAAAEHMNGKPDQAIRVLQEAISKRKDEWNESQKTAKVPKNNKEIQERQNAWLEERHQLGEAHLYYAFLLEEQGKFQEAVDYLIKNEKELPDKLGVREIKANLYLKMGNMKLAEEAFRLLLKINCENEEYNEGLVKALGITGIKVIEHYDALCKAEPKSILLQTLRLKALCEVGSPNEMNAFGEKLKELLLNSFRRGVPSMFQALKSVLYKTKQSKEITEQIISTLLSELTSETNSNSSNKKEPPTSELWVLHFAAQHYSFIGDTEKALKLIEKAKNHTPTVVDVRTAHARILRHAGDLVGAAEEFDYARRMDLADRYLNTRCTRYLLRANRPLQAFKTVSMFLKDTPGQTAQDSLADLQVSWFEYDAGLCYFRLNDLGHALKMFLSIEKHFLDFIEDQFDFHYFCFRKSTLLEYMKLIRLSDNMLCNRIYISAVLGAVKTYFAIYEQRKLNKAITISKSIEPNVNVTSLEDKEKQEKQEKEKGSKHHKPEKEVKPNSDKDTDPNGEKLAQVEDPLKEVERLLKSIPESCNILKVQVLLAKCEMFLKQSKLNLAVSELVKAKKLQQNIPEVLKFSILILNEISGGTSSEISKEELNEIANGISNAFDFAEKMLKDHSSSTEHVSSILEALIRIIGNGDGDDNKKKKVSEWFNLLFGIQINKNDCSINVLEKVNLFIQNVDLLSAEQKEQFRLKCKNVFPFASCFKNENEILEQIALITSSRDSSKKKEENP